MQRGWKIVWGLISVGILFLAFSIPHLVVFAEPSAEWIKTFGGTGDDVAHAVEVGDDGYVLAGNTNSSGLGRYDVWLIKTDSTGVMEWNRTYGGLFNDMGYSLVATSDGGYALAGDTASFGAGDTDVWLVKVDSLGNLEWNKTYGVSIADYCDSMVISSDGGYTLACISQERFGDGDFWLAKVDSTGGLEWNQTYGVSAYHSHTSLLTTADGSYIFGGSTRDSMGNQDFWLAKIGETDTGSEFLICLLIPILVISVLIVFVFMRTKNSQNKS